MAQKDFTNYAAGARGVNLKDGTTRWIEPGETVKLDDKQIVGAIPDLGTAPSDDPGADAKASAEALAAAQSEIAALKDDLAARDATIAELTAPKA